MNKFTSLCIHLIVLGVLTCLTTAVSLRHKRNAQAEYKWPEPDPNIDQFPHQSSCHHYYIVISEEDITINKCPHGELFDYVEHKCKDKESARCWSHHFGKMKHHHIPLKSSGSFTCPYAWGKYPDVSDCTKYYTCLSGKVKHKKCAQFEHFDKISRKCVGTITGVCADKTDVVEREFKCTKYWGSFSFHKDCSKYYECLEKQPDLRTCPNDTLFHEKRGKCVPKNHVHCGSRHNPYTRKDETPATAEVSLSKNYPTTSSESKKSSVESQTGEDVKISPKVELNRGEVQSVSQVPQEPKDVSDSASIKSSETSITNEPKSNVIISTESELNRDGFAKVLKTSEAPKELATGDISNRGNDPTPKKPNSDFTISPSKGPSSDKTKVLQTSQMPKELTTGDISNSGNDPTPKKTNSEFVVSPSQGPISDETKLLVEHNTNKNLNDTDELPDSLNTNEFIEVSSDSGIPVSTASHTIAVESSEKIKGGSTDNKEDQKTSMESSQVTPSDECRPKDYTCIVEEDGTIIRCPKSDGIFPYPADERRFLQCTQGEIRVKYCPGHTIFSYPQKKCISKIIF